VLRPPVRVCFVCSGNICRSPTAEVVLAAVAEHAGLAHLVEVDSAGTGGWHEGEDMDHRARAVMTDAGYGVPRHRAKQFQAADFADRDVVVALDSTHHLALAELADATDDPVAARAKIVRLRHFDPALDDDQPADVPDPYFGDADGFTEVLEQVRRSCDVLLDAIEVAVASGAGVAAPARQQEAKPPL
jgi:protein-tyrosine phosphatase